MAEKKRKTIPVVEPRGQLTFPIHVRLTSAQGPELIRQAEKAKLKPSALVRIIVAQYLNSAEKDKAAIIEGVRSGMELIKAKIDRAMDNASDELCKMDKKG